MDWLDEQMASAAVDACDDRRPASLREVEFPVPRRPASRRSTRRFPTTDRLRQPGGDRPEGAGAPGARRERRPDLHDDEPGRPQPGHRPLRHLRRRTRGQRRLARLLPPPPRAGRRRDGDVPGRRHRLDGGPDHRPGDPGPAVRQRRQRLLRAGRADGQRDRRRRRRRSSPNAQARARSGRSTAQRTEFCVPLENNLFRAAFEAGLFGERQGYTNCQPTGQGRATRCTRRSRCSTSAPDLQFLVNPGEAFPGADAGRPVGHRGRELPEPRRTRRCRPGTRARSTASRSGSATT